MTVFIIHSEGSFPYVSNKTNMINLLSVSRLFHMFTWKNSYKSIIQDHLITGLDLYLAL